MSDLTSRIQRYAENLIAAYPDVTAGEVMTVRRAPTRLRPVLVAAAAAVIVLIVIGGLTLLLNTENRPVIAPVTTSVPVPTTTPALTTSSAPATTAPTTTTTAVPTITWARVESPTFTESASQMIKGMAVVGSTVYLTGYYETGEGEDGEEEDGAVIWRSEDGQTWKRFDDPAVFGGPGFQNILDIASRNGVTVAVGTECGDDSMQFRLSTLADACVAAVWVSDDEGRTWARLPHQDAFGWRDLHQMWTVTATAEGFVAAGGDIWTSPDGLQWTVVESLPNGNDSWGIVAGPSTIVAAGQRWPLGSEAAMWWSTDGSRWTRVSDEDGQFEGGLGKVSWLEDVIAAENGLVAVGTAGRNDPVFSIDAAVWLSTTGRTWRRVPDTGSDLHGFYEEIMYGVAATGDLLVAAGAASNKAAFNLDPGDAHGVGVVWLSQDGGATWARMDDPDHVFGSFLSDFVGIRRIAAYGDGLVAAGWDGADSQPAVWIGTIDRGD